MYLEDIPLETAWAAFRAALSSTGRWQPLPSEEIGLSEATGRITAKTVWAKISSPHYHASAMDGYAVRAADTIGANETTPITLTLVEPNDPEPKSARPAQAINTGQPLPGWANAVVMIEHTQAVAGGIEIGAALPPWHHVRPMGEDMVATEMVLPANHRLRPADLGALAGSGQATVWVYRRPRVAIIPTGSELVPVEAAAGGRLRPGQIIEYNSLVLAAQVAQWGGIASRQPIVADELAAIQAAVQAVADYDLILLNAGSSAGSEDYAAQVVQSLGQLLVHGVAVRPGHPVILGILGNGTPIIGVPGYPVSAALTGEIFVEPLLAAWQGQQPYQPPTIAASLTHKIVSSTGDEDFVRVAVGQVGERILATPIGRGAGVITSLVRADGLVRIPRFQEGADVGSQVTVHLYRPEQDIAKTIVAIGSHDLLLDLLAQFLAEQGQGVRLSSANVGSLGGLLALRRGEAHLAGSHLLDAETGQYNLSYLARYLPGRELTLVTLCGREQGWLVAAGNPKGIAGWGDVARPDIRLVNRQRGAGTRLLLEYELGKLGVAPAGINGYDREEYTHLAVAAAVAAGTADMGLGIRAAATALQLDFVPLAYERYDLVIPTEHYHSPRLRPLLDLLYNPHFRAAAMSRPGYDIGEMGNTVSLGL